MSRLVDQSLGKPIQGVSQQAESLRGQGQCNEQINFLPDPVAGLRRRPNTQYVRTISDYTIYADYTDKEGDKMLCAGGSEVAVYNPVEDTLTVATIANTDAYDYIMSGFVGGTRRSTAFVEGSLYIGNPLVTVEEDTGYTPPTRITNVGIVTCLGGQYARTYKIDITTTTTTHSASYTTPDGTTSGDIDTLAGSFIIGELQTAVDAFPSITATQENDHLLISHATDDFVSITCSDDEGNIALKCTYNSVKEITDLPELAPANTVVTVAGEAGSEDDAYFEFKLLNSAATGLGTFGEAGVWVESVKDGDEFQFDTTTLPVKLTQDDLGNYTLDLADWKGREIGDTESNETPSIHNNKIVDLTSLQGRLGILSEESVLFSRTKRPTELWRRSIIGGIQTDDAIDGSGDSSTGTHTHFAKNAQDLAVFTKQGQYVILGNQALTPSSVNLTLTTRNTSVEEVAPIGIAGNLYYVTDNGDYMGMSEYFKEDLTYFSFPVSNHIPRYITGRATQLKGSNPQHMLAMQTDADLKRLYCYKFLFSGKRRVQSAWFKMDFLKDIKHYFFSGNTMIIISDNSTEHLVEKLEFDKEITGGLEFEIHLDLSQEYVLDVDKQITVGTIHQDPSIVFISLDSSAAGLPVDYEDLGGGVYQMETGEEGDTVVAGYRFESLYSPTAPRYFDRNKEVVQTGELQVHNLLVNAAKSGVFSWKVETTYGTVQEGDISNRVWGDANNLIGGEPLFTRQWTIPWRGRSTEKAATITCDRHTPLEISYIEFTGDIRKTRQRI